MYDLTILVCGMLWDHMIVCVLFPMAQSHLSNLLWAYFAFFICKPARWFRNRHSLFPCFLGKIRAKSYVRFNILGLWNVVGAWFFGCVSFQIFVTQTYICFPAHLQNGDEQKYSFGPNLWKKSQNLLVPNFSYPPAPLKSLIQWCFFESRYALQPIFWIYNVVTMPGFMLSSIYLTLTNENAQNKAKHIYCEYKT